MVQLGKSANVNMSTTAVIEQQRQPTNRMRPKLNLEYSFRKLNFISITLDFTTSYKCIIILNVVGRWKETKGAKVVQILSFYYMPYQ